MTLYIFLFILVSITAIIAPYNKKLAYIWLFVLCFLSMFRAESVGTDTSNYMDIAKSFEAYENLSRDGFTIGRAMEILYFAVVILINTYLLPNKLIILFFSFTTFVFLFLSIKKSQIPYNIGILIFLILFYLSSFNIARQICASCIVLYGYTFLFEDSKKRFLFFLYLVLSTMIHASSCIYIILYCIRWFNYYKVNSVLLIVLAILLFLFNAVSPVNFIEKIASIVDNISYTQTYDDRLMATQRTFFGVLFDLIKFSSLLFLFITVIKVRRLNKTDILFYLSILSVVFSASLNSDISRIFIPIQIFQVIYVGLCIKNRWLSTKDFAFIYYVFVNAFLTLWGVAQGSGEVIPYIMSFEF